jgi:hypothetical protein
MEPDKVAKLVMNRIEKYCLNTNDYFDDGDDPFLECLEDHRPGELEWFIDEFLPEKVAKNLGKPIPNSDNKFWDEVKKKYKELWEKQISLEVGEFLGDELEELYRDTVLDDDLSYEDKVDYLEDYADYLKYFGDEIKRALKDKKPLDEYDLYNWYWRIGHNAFGINSTGHYDLIGYYTGYYDVLSDNDKLNVLKMLLDVINNMLPDIYEDLKYYKSKLEASTNKN